MRLYCFNTKEENETDEKTRLNCLNIDLLLMASLFGPFLPAHLPFLFLFIPYFLLRFLLPCAVLFHPPLPLLSRFGAFSVGLLILSNDCSLHYEGCF